VVLLVLVFIHGGEREKGEMLTLVTLVVKKRGGSVLGLP